MIPISAMKLTSPATAVSDEICAMPSGPCRLSAPIAPVRMLAIPVSDWVITTHIRSTP